MQQASRNRKLTEVLVKSDEDPSISMSLLDDLLIAGFLFRVTGPHKVVPAALNTSVLAPPNTHVSSDLNERNVAPRTSRTPASTRSCPTSRRA